jgi:integrase
MPPRRKPTPSYLPHNQSGRARAVWTDQTGTLHFRMLPGAYDSPESRSAFGRLQLELEGQPHRASTTKPSGQSVSDMLLAFLDHAERYYRAPDGQMTSEVGEVRWSIKPVRELYGYTRAAEFGPRALAGVRQHMIGLGWCRSLINRRIDRVKRAFKWAASEELVPVTTYEALRTLTGLRKGRTEARESDPIKPVDLKHVRATLPFLTPHLRAMVELQRLTGMRPGEVCQFRFDEVDRSRDVWVYRPSQHKTAHHGKSRTVAIGPKAQRVVCEFLRGDTSPPEAFANIDTGDETTRLVTADAYQEAGRERDAELLRDLSRPILIVFGCIVDPALTQFSPDNAREERFRAARRSRKSKVTPSQQNRRKQKPELVPASEYTSHTYSHAVRVAAAKAGVPHWHPNQLRHTFATNVRKEEGLEAAQVMLGHSRADVTQVYAERNESLALKLAAKIG